MTISQTSRQKKIVIIEDDPLMTMLLEDLLNTFGYEVVMMANHIEDASNAITETHFDAAILDVNIGGFNSYDIADRLIAKNIPFLFSTGYHESSLPERFATYPILQKPYDQNLLKKQLEYLFDQ